MPAPQIPFKIAVSTGSYRMGIAELSSAVRKLGSGLTRGVSAIEIFGDIPHEINYTQGAELRYIAEKQGVDLLFHGPLNVPLTMGELGLWTDAQNAMRMAVTSAVLGGCKYVNFHSCLYYWPEHITRAEVKLIWVMVDEMGEPIRRKLKENSRLLEWFLKKYGSEYAAFILTAEERTSLRYKAEELERELERLVRRGAISREDVSRELERRYGALVRECVRDHILKGKEWADERVGSPTLIYEIMAHYLLFSNDPVWKEMYSMYSQVVGPVGSGLMWLDDRLKRAQKDGDVKFKEFYYGVVAAKYLMGHVKTLLDWMRDELPKKIEEQVDALARPADRAAEKAKLKKVCQQLVISFETPDAREPRYAGMYNLWHPKQVYVAVKVAREQLDTKRIMLLPDFEHIATQGVDPLMELEELISRTPDIGRFIMCVHSNDPNPLHAHNPIEMGDVVVYKLLWALRRVGLGRHHTTYLLFERGGGEDPFRQSVTSLKIMAEHLVKGVAPSQLPPKFFGISLEEIAAWERQLVAIREHAFEPLKPPKRPEEKK